MIAVLLLVCSVVALAPAQIPSTCNTAERLAVWLLGVLQFACTNQQVVLANDADPVRRCSLSLIATPDGNTHWVGLFYIPADLTLLHTSGNKLWVSPKEVATSTIPTIFTTN